MYLSEVEVGHRQRRLRFISPYLGETQHSSLPGFSPAEEKALRITTTFETGRPLGFGGLTGNFDGQGLSFGLQQWNIGTGSLQPLLLEFARDNPAQFAAIFGPHATQLLQMLSQPRAEQLRFARSINDDRNRIIEPWASYFRRLREEPAFQQIQLRHVRPRMNSAINYARQLRLRSERGLALMFDNVTQNGPAWLQRAGRAARIQQRVADFQQRQGRPPQEREFLAIIANVVADTVDPRWRENVRRRRMTIVEGRGRVHGHDFDLEREFGLTDQPWETTAGTAPLPASQSVNGLGETTFLERVLQAHIARSTARRGRPLPDLRPDQLAQVAGTGVEMRSDAAAAAGRLIAAANQDLAAAKSTGDSDTLKTVRILATSGYRGRAHQERLWRQYFSERYYPRTADQRSRLPGGPDGDAAVQYMVEYIAPKIAAPGFSNHQAGLAIDLRQERTQGNEIYNSTDPEWVQKWQSTWFFRWLQQNATRFGFHPYVVEPWHWEFRL
jgi:hypothetical protein